MILYARIAGVLALVVGIFAIGYHFGEMPYKTKYEALQADDWQAKAKGEEAAKTVIAGQLVALQNQIKVNSDAMQTLQQQKDAIASDRDATLGRVRRLEQLLVAAASRPASGSGSVPQAGSGPGAIDTGDIAGTSQIEGLLINAATECEQTASQLNALIAEITPQL